MARVQKRLMEAQQSTKMEAQDLSQTMKSLFAHEPYKRDLYSAKETQNLKEPANRTEMDGGARPFA